MLLFARGGSNVFDFVHQGFQVLRSGAAAAADHAHAVLLGKLEERLGECFRFKRVNSLAVHVERQAGIGNAGDGQSGVLRQVADRFAHQVRAGGAVEADHVDGEGFEDGQHAGDIGAEQHAPGGIQRDLGLDGQHLAGFGEGVFDAQNCGFDLEDILRGLDQQQVHAAFD